MTDVMADAGPQTLSWGRGAYKYPGLFLGSGNRCGHDPQRFAADRLALPEVAGGHRLQIITRLLKKLEGYFSDAASVPLLAYRDDKKNLDGSPRQNRSEDREAQILILKAIIAALDFKSLRVGTYAVNGDFKNLPFEEIARRCGLTRPSKDPAQPLPVPSSRFWRGVGRLKRAGVLDIYEQYEETPDGKRGRPAIKTVSEKFLRVLGSLTKNAMKTVRNKVSRKVDEFLGRAVQGGVQSRQEAEQLSGEIRSQRVHKQLSPKAVVKNQFPKEVVRDNSADSLQADYTAYTQYVYAQIAAELGRPLRGAGGIRLFTQHGGLSPEEWGRRRLNR